MRFQNHTACGFKMASCVLQLVEYPPPNLVGYGFNSRSVMPKTWQTLPAACPALCSALMIGCKEKFHARCCHWLVINAAFVTKVAVWPMAQANGDGHRWPFVPLRKEWKNEYNKMNLNHIVLCNCEQLTWNNLCRNYSNGQCKRTIIRSP